MARVAEVSVAIATLNRPEALARCLDALLDADVLPAETIVVDQGVTEPTATLLAGRGGGPVALVHIPQARRGLSVARNAAISAARYPILAITDDDCVPD